LTEVICFLDCVLSDDKDRCRMDLIVINEEGFCLKQHEENGDDTD